MTATIAPAISVRAPTPQRPDDLPSAPSAELRRLAARVLDEHREVADALTDMLLRQEPSYREGEARVPEPDLRVTVLADVESVLEHLAGRRDLGPQVDAQREIGERRAAQGLPLESLLRAYQLGGQMIWQRIAELATADPQTDMADLLVGGSYLWDVVDRLCTAVGTSYRNAAAALARQTARRREVLFDALLDGRAADVTLAREAALALFLPAEGPYLVVVADRPFSFGREPELELRGHGLASCWRLRGHRQIGIVATERTTAAQLADQLRTGVAGRAGVSPPTPYLGGVAEALRLAELALATVVRDAPGVALFDESMVGALIVSAPDVARRLADRVLASLLELEPANRELLLSTLQAYFDADGSVAAAADRLYFHRNTVLNRLRRIEGLTGMSLNRPRDVATLIVVLETLRLLPPADPGP